MTLLPRTGVAAQDRKIRGRAVSMRPAPATGVEVARGWSATGTLEDLPTWAGSHTGGSISHRVAIVPGAASLDDVEFERRTMEAYAELLDGIPVESLLRAWNFIPGINDPAGDRDGRPCDRYMRFNAGRYHGFRRRYDASLDYPVASGVGHLGDDLVVHLLHGSLDRRLIDNARQVKPHAYSDRFGDPPPVFARASCVDDVDRQWLLVSGTASVVGEDSVHSGSFEEQISETLRNLEMVVKAGWSDATPVDLDDWLVYLPDAGFSNEVRKAVADRWPHRSPAIVFREQALCRPELLVEIECAGFRGASES